MENIFNSYQQHLLSVCNTTFGTTVIWHCSDGSMQQAQALYGEPSKKVQLGETEYLPPSYHIEYMNGLFVGLKENANSGMLEILEVSSTRYHVLQVHTKFDGKTLIAVLTPA